MNGSLSVVLVYVLIPLLSVGVSQATGGRVAIVTDASLSAPAVHGLTSLEKALTDGGFSVERLTHIAAPQADFFILAGLTAGDGVAARTLKTLDVRLPQSPESLVVHRTRIEGKSAVILCATDARGLMYAALDTADRISWSDDPENPFADVRNTSEEPFVRERAVSMYTMQRAYFESRLYDEDHWRRYFDVLARSRINSFVVIFGYENGGFMAPPYPYFFDVDEFPQVKLTGITPAQQRRNVKAFNRMIEMAHDRGIEFTAGIWDHIYRGGVQGGGIKGASEQAGKKVDGLVWGVTAENLAPYTKAALRKFLDVFGELDALQLRMHGESGLRRGEMQAFWHEVFAMIKQMCPDMRVDTRAKELPDAIIQDGLAQGLNLRVATKYWMEQMGLPFHPTHVNPQNQHDRRHGYADLLRYPQRYKVHWRLWNGGTTRFLLWGDPEYVRRFAMSTRVYDGDSFEVNEMLATKMLGEPHDAAPFELLTPEQQYYDYEFERYWHYYQLWGRTGYDPCTPSEVWEREFQRRFGPEAGPVLMRAMHHAGRVLPRIVAASYPYRYFPTTRGWAEMMRMNDLPAYAQAEGSDVQQFMNTHDHARSIIDGADTAMRRPTETSGWFGRASAQILQLVDRAEEQIADKRTPEFVSTVTDLKILAHLAAYHAQRLLAAVHYNLYKLTDDLFAFDDAIAHENRAIQAWEQIVHAAAGVYNRDLAFGVHRVGFSRHWYEELQKLRIGVDQLNQQRREAHAKPEGDGLRIAHVPVRRHRPGRALQLRATVYSNAAVNQVRVGIADRQDRWQFLDMKPTDKWQYQAVLPAMKEGEAVRYFIEARDARNRSQSIPSAATDGPFVAKITDDQVPPHVELERVKAASPAKDLTVTAKVWDPSGLQSVRLRYRNLTQFEDYRSQEMSRDPATGLWSAEIPATFIDPTWDLMYFVEAIDNQGNGRMYPDLETEMPYVIVRVDR